MTYVKIHNGQVFEMRDNAWALIGINPLEFLEEKMLVLMFRDKTGAYYYYI